MSRQCSECGCTITEKTGWGVTTTLADGAPCTMYCGGCNPNKGRGYTLADLEQWREDSKVERARYELSLMEKVGTDVYFYVKEQP